MPVWTPGERRGALLLALLLLLGAARDLWRASHPVAAPPPVESPSAAGDAPAPAVGGPGAPPAATAGAPPVDLNRAGPAELDALPGIGPVLAGRIVRHRSEHGPFRGPDDLLAVPGIGPRLLERLRARVRAAPPSPDSAPRGVAIGNPASPGRVQIPVQERRGRGR
jgi:competence ComEA-like helix-hairpin-helix protein